MVDHFQACEFWLPPEFLTDDSDLKLKQSGKEVDFNKDGFHSLLGSTESESDEDEYVTRHQNKKGFRLSSSPKSPLCKASGEFATKKMASVPTNPPSYQQSQAIRFQDFRRQQMMNQTQQNSSMGLPVCAWPPLQRPQPGAGMRTLFLGNNLGGLKKQCAGTGVFLPRTVSSTGNRKNKPACSQVLMPERVVQALNLNLETLGLQNEDLHHSRYYNNNGVFADYGAGLKFNYENKKNHVMVQQRQTIAKAEPENQEVIRLPPEWIY